MVTAATLEPVTGAVTSGFEKHRLDFGSAQKMIEAQSNLLAGRGGFAGALAIVLVLASVVSRPLSIADGGAGALLVDLTLLLACLLLGAWAWQERRAAPARAFRIGRLAGLALGTLLVARHAVESFEEPDGTTALVLGVGLVFTMLALFATAGSMARSATNSISLGILAGIRASALALEMLIAFAFACILVFSAALSARLDEPFRASGMSDLHAYLVRHGLDSALEGLTRMPLIAFLASGSGAVASAWIARTPRTAQRAMALSAPCVLAGGAWLLYHANGLERAARPPFVMSGVLLAAAALCVAHPIWSALRSLDPTGRLGTVKAP